MFCSNCSFYRDSINWQKDSSHVPLLLFFIIEHVTAYGFYFILDKFYIWRYVRNPIFCVLRRLTIKMLSVCFNHAAVSFSFSAAGSLWAGIFSCRAFVLSHEVLWGLLCPHSERNRFWGRQSFQGSSAVTQPGVSEFTAQHSCDCNLFMRIAGVIRMCTEWSRLMALGGMCSGPLFLFYGLRRGSQVNLIMQGSHYCFSSSLSLIAPSVWQWDLQYY